SRVSDHSRIFFSGLSMACTVQRGGAESRLRYNAESLSDHFDAGLALAGAFGGLEASLALAAPKAADEMKEAIVTLQRRAGEQRHDLLFLIRASDPDFVYYLEARGRTLFLRASPVDVSRIV